MVFLELSLFRKAFRFIGAVLCDVIYTLISKVYELFITVARLNILSSSQIQPIYQRITMILTIVMVFYVTFEFVKYTISPDTITDKEKGAGNILKRIIIVIVLIAFVPEIFTVAYKLQNRIIETQLISKVILGSSNADYTTYGNDFSANMLNLFYYYDEDACSSTNAGLINECSEAKQAVAEKLEQIRQTGDSDIVDGINLASGKATFKEVNPAIKFNGILAILVGGFILYILIMYSIDVGTRYAQLIFLQVISPIAIMGYLLPKKDGIFQKWGKQCITTYIDLFLRIAIINFVLLITKVLGDAFQTGNIFQGMDVSTSLKAFTYIVLVMGLLAFAQRAPKLLGELFPSMGSAGIGFGLGAKNRLEPSTKALKGTLGTAGKVVGGVAGMAAGAYLGAKQNGWKEKGKGRAWSAVKGAYKGAAGGLGKNGGLTKGVAAARESAAKDRDTIEAGGSPFGASFRGGHYSTQAKDQDIIATRNENVKKYRENTLATADEVKSVKQAKAYWESLKAGGAPEAEIEAARKEYKAREKAALQQKVTEVKDATGKVVDRYIEYEGYQTDATGKVILDSSGKPTKITKQLRFDAEDQVRMGGVRDQIAKMVTNMKAEGTAEDLTIKIKQSDGTEKEVKVIDLMPKEDPPKKDDPDYDTKIKEYNEKCAEFINHMGEIATAAEEKAKEMKRSSEYLQAHANASNSGKK